MKATTKVKSLKKENSRLRRLIVKAMKYGAREALRTASTNFDYIDTTKFFVKNGINEAGVKTPAVE